MKKDFISLLDFTPDELQFIIDQAAQLKNAPRNACDLLKGKSFALIFQKPSNRTRVSFETGIFQMGGNPIYLAPEDINLGRRIAVMARKDAVSVMAGVLRSWHVKILDR